MSDKASKPAAGRRQKALGGRPSKYKRGYAALAAKLCELGATDEDLAEAFQVTARSIYRWQTTFPEFCQALKVAKGKPDDRVERSLYLRAVGYSYDAVKVFVYRGRPITVPYREHVPPDVTAAIFWLKNRRSGYWRDAARMRDRPLSFPLFGTDTVQDMSRTNASILQAVAKGELTPIEARSISELLGRQAELVEHTDHEARLAEVESRLNRKEAK